VELVEYAAGAVELGGEEEAGEGEAVDGSLVAMWGFFLWKYDILPFCCGEVTNLLFICLCSK
jgi:hypothetical protein